jgi:5-formyltetrahydrofolate cyclo-ligase
MNKQSVTALTQLLAKARREKAMLRRKVALEVRGLSPERRTAAAARARAALQQQRIWQDARSVLLFAPLPEELDVWPLVNAALASGKQVALPRYTGASSEYIACWVREPEKELELGQYGIREPNERCTIAPLLRLDFILVPGVAFDLHGRRLGRGRGHYDRMLAAARGTTCGAAFDEQIVREVPVEPHDVHLNCILTPTRWIEL